MFKIESYVTPILLSYVDKYVRDFKPADAQVSLWGGGVALHNLVLKADVLQKEVALPFTLISGRIHELLIQVPWTKIMSEPIVVTIDTIECVLSLNPPVTPDGPPSESPSRKAQVVETPPGYMQALVRRIVSNIALRVHHLIVKYVQDDIVMSLNVKHLAVDSAGINWEPAFADIDQNHPVIRRLVRLDDLTLCLDKSDDDGKIRFFQEPLLYRCQLDLRVLTRLISANTRRATNLNVQLRSTRLAWSITNDQLVLLLRLVRERPVTKPQSPAPKQSVTQLPPHTISSNSAEPARSESWSEWAWSWLPTWMDREGGVEEAPVPATPLPVFFTAFLDEVSIVFKVMEMENMNRKRSRSILEVNAVFAALKSTICTPTSLRVRFGARDVLVRSQGKCVCGHVNFNSANDEPTDFLKKIGTEGIDRQWSWPEEDLNEKVETAEVVDETFRASPTQSTIPEGNPEQSEEPSKTASKETQEQQDKRELEETDDLWAKMSPLLYVEYNHERSPPTQFTNPYESPPKDFEYSDWVEECNMSIQLEPVEIRVCMGLVHRLNALRMIYLDRPPPQTEQQMRILTIEENEALTENLPQKRISIEARGLCIRIIPWNHVPADRCSPAPLVLELRIPKTSAAITAPLYPHRVCSAACQMPQDKGPLYLGARRHITVTVSSLQAYVCNPGEAESRPCARADIRLVTHQLLNKAYFAKQESIEFAYHLKIKEFSICGSSARLQAAFQVPLSLFQKRRSLLLKHTTIAKDALNDEEAVAVDIVMEDLILRGYITNNVRTHVATLQSAKATAFHAPKGGELKQAWLFSAPAAPASTTYFRMAIQWCKEQLDDSVDYMCMWAQPLAISVDPLLIAFLAYKPTMRPDASMNAIKTLSSTQSFMRRRATPPSSSGRGLSRTGSGQGAELVHVRSRSHGSGSEPSEKKDTKFPIIPVQPKSPDTWWSGENLVALYKRLRSMLINIEVGLVLVYVTMSTASAIDCATIRDAMERHASEMHRVLAISLGRLSVTSSSATKSLWAELRHDGPTYVSKKLEAESFPWKLCLADVSCYTLEVRPVSGDVTGLDRAGASAGLKSRLKVPPVAMPRTVLELVTTSITISVETKSIQYKNVSRKQVSKSAEIIQEDQRTKYFTSGTEFKPTTLKEFVRGPSERQKRDSNEVKTSTTNEMPSPNEAPPEVVTVIPGPVVSLGVHLHADTPPIIIRLERDQIHIVAAAIHCFTHIHTLLKRDPICLSRQAYTSLGGSHRSLIRSVSEIDEVPSTSETPSEKSELVSLFERNVYHQRPLKTFYWFQWVVSRATLVVASRTVKLALDIDDIISTVDVQAQYNQLKIKLASASIKHYERGENDEWSTGVMGGRVLEAREPADAKEDAHFLSVTITQALLDNLPASWKEELHPKLLEPNISVDSMWEVCATLAPLEAVLQPAIMDNVMSLVKEMAPRAFCPLKGEMDHRLMTWQWPFCYITAGGIRLLVTGEQLANSKSLDDTIIFSVGKININPHPDNPICRRAVNAGTDGGWLAASGGFDGRQYEIVVKDVSVRSSNFSQLALAEKNDACKGSGSENPALKWSNRPVRALMMPILHTVELCCVLAPALYVGGALSCGPAVELNLVSDCGIELSIAQLVLLKTLTREFIVASHRESFISTSTMDTALAFDKHGVCPYATLIMKPEIDILSPSNVTLVESVMDSKTSIENDLGHSVAGDSGVETVASSSKATDEVLIKKTVSVAFVEQIAEAAQYLEVFVTMGVIDLSLYVADDNSPEVIALRPPHVEQPEGSQPTEANAPQPVPKEERTEDKGHVKDSATGHVSRSLTELVRETDAGQTLLDISTLDKQARKIAGNVTLMQITLFQPNLYYWKKKTLKTLQLSLFNAWVALGVGDIPGQWHAVLLATAQGVSDPVTDIPPALATLKVVAPIGPNYPTTGASSSNSRGTIRLDVEKPVQVDLSTDKLMRLKNIYALLEKHLQWNNTKPDSEIPILYTLRNTLAYEGMESMTIQTSQISVCGWEGTVGWDSASLQVSASNRPDRLNARSLITALLVAAGPPGDRRHVVLQPLMLGMELEALWEAWRRAEGGVSAREPCVKVGIELDHVVFDLRPSELIALNRLRLACDELLGRNKEPPVPASSAETLFKHSTASAPPQTVLHECDRRPSPVFVEPDVEDHFYKDDLRSGAFKISSGGQLPMAYQVILHGNAVSWRYPHPRAITRLVAFPLPGQDTEIDCVLELYTEMLGRWEPHTYFQIPVGEPRELNLYVPPPDAAFAIMWRFRSCAKPEPTPPTYEFDINKFTPRSDPLIIDHPQEQMPKYTTEVTAEQLSGVLRIDSYFSPRLLSHNKVILRVGHLQVHAHNSLPYVSSQANCLEGYYVSKPLMRTHRVLSLSAQNTTAHAHLGSPAGVLYVLDTNLACDIVDCATGTMEQLVEQFRVQSSVSVCRYPPEGPRARVFTTGVHVALQVPRLRTLQSLAADWTAAYNQYACEVPSADLSTGPETKKRSKREVAATMARALEGRVSLWIHNSCASAMRAGQEGTDEVVPLGPGARLAYRWRSPTAPKKLRLALAGPTTDWQWSASLPFTPGHTRLKLETPLTMESKVLPLSAGAFVHVKIEESGASRFMHLSGRLVLANMLRSSVLYKVRAHTQETTLWRTVCSGELSAETVERSVVCSAECEMVLKIRFRSHNTGWSGDIPLKECPKENVPWLVKVPTEGDMQFVSVWCRVVRGRSDGRVLATLWPLYVLHSHLPLDTDVLIATEPTTTTTEDLTPVQLRQTPTLQLTPGRGTSTHLKAPGTTAAKHSLSFQYSIISEQNIECPVTREAVPLHYGVTDTSVFDKRAPVSSIEDVIQEILRWLERSGNNAISHWPYSLVSKHWDGEWQPASLQPRCDVTVRYQPVRAGGGCSLEISLCPVALLCNATPIALTLRAHDAAPLCKLESGTAISPPSAILSKPFFMSVEMGRETYVSSQLQVSAEEPGRYGSPPPGQVAIDHAAHFSILCNQKVALLTLYYEIKEEINVLGVSSTYMLINRLDTDILVSAIAVPNHVEEDVTLRPKSFKVVPPTKEGSFHGTSLSRFWLRGRWRGGDVTELRTYLCFSLPHSSYPVRLPVPIRLGEPPVRRAVALIDDKRRSIPVVVSQLRHDSQWVVVVAHDPCPQFVVYNHTQIPFAVAQPLHFADEPSTSHTEAAPECPGARWWCMVPPDSAVHYSTPAHCARYPPQSPPPLATSSNMLFLTFARGKDDTELQWCSPVVAADGEQLLQYYGGVTIKLRVSTYPHSTLLELQDVDHTDISASDIRRRLFGAIASAESETSEKQRAPDPDTSLQRTDANSRLLRDETIADEHDKELQQLDQPAQSKPLPEDEATSTKTDADVLPDRLKKKDRSSTVVLFATRSKGRDYYIQRTSRAESKILHQASDMLMSQTSFGDVDVDDDIGDLDSTWADYERFRCVISSIVVEMAAAPDVQPLLALHLDRTALLIMADDKTTKTILSIADAQIDNLQYDNGQYDFAVVASTRAEALEADHWPPLWNMFAEKNTFATRQNSARLLLNLQHDMWEVVQYKYKELTEMEVKLGTLALYVEDAYVKALVDLSRLLAPTGGSESSTLSEERSLQTPLRLRLLHVHPLDLTLTLHTAVRMYIALDQSPLRLSAFKLHDMMTSSERLTHALTVHYLSAAILGAGWVVGGLELLGAPGALAARLGGATGGVRAVASAAAAALLRSLSAWAGSLARNLDLLAGDEEHARRAAAARRRLPPSFLAGLVAGITNFAINILGAVGGLAHHPLVGVAVGETESGAAALRRGLLGALTKPLSATADLVAYAGTGLLRQTGWDPVPEPRRTRSTIESRTQAGWQRDCVRWMFRLCELTALAGFEVLLDNAPLQLLLTHKFLVVADPETERIVEMIDFRFCTLEPYRGQIIELCVTQRRQAKIPEARMADEDDEYQISATAMARVARYTGAEGGAPSERRVLSLLPPPGRSHALHAALAAALHHNADSHFPML